MALRLILSPLIILAFCICAVAADRTAEEQYEMGIKLFQEQNFTDARAAFAKTLDLDPSNKSALYNLGLAELKLGHKGAAIGAWRRAIRLDPGFRPAQQALRYALTQVESLEKFSNADSWETFRSSVLNLASLHKFLAATFLFLGLSGVLLIRYVGRYKTAIANEQSLPKVPIVGILLAICFVAFLGLSVAKAIDLSYTRATITTNKTEIKTGPSTADSSLFTLPEGSEVLVLNRQSDWAQVAVPGGLSGWVPQTALFFHSGPKSW